MAGGRDESNIFFNKKDDDDGVIVRIWMGPVAPTLANLLIYQHSQFLKPSPSLKKYMILSKISTLVGIIYF